MFSDDNLLTLIFSLIPAVLYTLIVYATTPHESVRLKIAFLYGVVGMLSATIVQTVLMIFPNWQQGLTDSLYVNRILLMYMQIAFTEEVSKFLSFKVLDVGRHTHTESDTPVAVMFYTMMTASAFAFMENLLYGSMFGSQVVIMRSFTAVVCHMICGVFMGYYISIGRLPDLSNKKTVFHNLIKRYPLIKRGAYTLLGLLIATIFHGTYDFVLSFALEVNKMLYMIILLVIGLIMSYIMGRELSKISNK